MPEHTPGPWVYDDNTATVDVGSVAVAGINFGDGIPWEQAEANARLISAAPDLLAALTGQRCFDCAQWIELGNPNHRPCDVCAPAMAAIAKATGKGGSDVGAD